MAVSTLVGFPVGFSQSGTGNKCVTEYSLVNDMSCREPRITIRFPDMPTNAAAGISTEPIDCGIKELHSHMRVFMSALKRITADVIHVTIRSAEQQDLVVVDPPGLILTPTNDREDRETQECIRQVGSWTAAGRTRPCRGQSSERGEESKRKRVRWTVEVLMMGEDGP